MLVFGMSGWQQVADVSLKTRVDVGNRSFTEGLELGPV